MNKLENTVMYYIKSDNLLQDTQQIIETAREFAYKTVNVALIQRNWLLGKRIAEEDLQGQDGKVKTNVLVNLSHLPEELILSIENILKSKTESVVKEKDIWFCFVKKSGFRICSKTIF